METIYEEGPETAASLKKILQVTDLFPEDLARLINVAPATMDRWLSGAPMDVGCAHVLLDLIWRYPDAVIFMLAEPEHFPGGIQTPWVIKLKSIQTRLGLSTTGMVELLNTQYPAFRKWMAQETKPSSCYQALINLLYYNTPKMVELLQARETEPEPPGWDKRRLQVLLGRLGLTSTELMETLGMAPSAVSGWVHGSRGPGPCATLFLNLLESSPRRVLLLITQADVEPAEAWIGDRVRSAREAVDLGLAELAGIYGTDSETIRKYEREGLPIEKGCPLLFYSLLEQEPEEFLGLIARLAV